VIREVTITGYKALECVNVTLEPLTVIVGGNASGKSSFLDAVDFLANAPGRPKAIQGVMSRIVSGGLRTRGSQRPVELVALNDEGRVRLRARDEGGWAHTFEPFEGTQVDLTKLPEGDSPATTGGQPRAIRLRLDGAQLSSPSDLTKGYSQLLPSGEGLAAVLQRLQLAKDGSFDAIEAGLRAVVPSASSLRTMPDNGQGKAHAVVEVFTKGAGWCGAEALSEGTLVTLAILTALHDSGRPGLVLLDDIDRGLHPRAQAELVKCIRGVMEREVALQIVCTTHSPHMVNGFFPEEVRLFSLDEKGHTVASKLTDHPDWPKWKDTFASGEFWAAVGDEWVVGATG
jgi:predicted ATPase